MIKKTKIIVDVNLKNMRSELKKKIIVSLPFQWYKKMESGFLVTNQTFHDFCFKLPLILGEK